MDKGHKFHALDALRGVAALAVMQFHMADFFGVTLFPEGHLAVDFFFILSGFVLTFAYQKKLDQGWSTSSFLLVRFIRLYPLYLLGLSIGFVLKLIQVRYGTVHPTMGAFLTIAALGLFVLPAPAGLQTYAPRSFPLNSPTWSLFYEMIANFVHVLFLRRRSWMFLAAVTGLSCAGMIFGAVKMGTTDFGSKRNEILLGVPRVLFSYTCGMLLFRVWQTGRVRVRAHPALLAAALLVLLAIPVRPEWTAVYELIVTMCLFPILLLVSASTQLGPRFIPVAGVLGTLSYSLYVLHYPLGESFSRLWVHVRGHEPHLDAPWSGLIYTAIAVSGALLVDTLYDLPVRGLLRRRLQGSHAQPAKTPLSTV